MEIHDDNIKGLSKQLYSEWSASEPPSATGLNTAVKWDDMDDREQDRWKVVAATAIRVLVTSFDGMLSEKAQEVEMLVDGDTVKRVVIDITDQYES